MQTVHLTVPFSYSVIWTKNIFNKDNLSFLDAIDFNESTKKQNCLFIVENTINDLHENLNCQIKGYTSYHNKYIKFLGYEVFKGGELCKNLHFVEKICKVFKEYKVCRHSFIIIIGGGSFIDAIGFAATITHRGLRQIRIPTTVLSQNDSAVGVKNAINAFNNKNFIGTFAPPFAVINDNQFLQTLSQRYIISGITEGIKVALIKDLKFFNWIVLNADKLKTSDSKELQYFIEKTANLHISHIENSGDPFEATAARPLDFGHWAAHKLEQMSNGTLLHGEAVSIGICIDAHYAKYLGYLSTSELEQIINLFKTLGLPIYNELLTTLKNGELEVFEGINDFREHLGGELHITLPKTIGDSIQIFKLDKDYLKKIFKYLKEL